LIANGKRRLKSWRRFCLEQAHQKSEHADRHEKSDPCQAEHAGAAVLLFVGQDRMVNHDHEQLPCFGAEILDLLSYLKNEHSFPHCTNPSLLARTEISKDIDFAPQSASCSRRLMV